MSKHRVDISWAKSESEIFTDNKYSRAHSWQFDGGALVPASSSPHVVPLPFSIEANVDPEEAFVASLSSCHMLWFLYLAAEQGYIVDDYRDGAVGVMAKNDEGKLAMTEVTLRPVVTSNIPEHKLEGLHHKAHEECFLANSVKTEITIEIG